MEGLDLNDTYTCPECGVEVYKGMLLKRNVFERWLNSDPTILGKCPHCRTIVKKSHKTTVRGWIFSF